MALSDEQLEAIRQRAERASPGPWRWIENRVNECRYMERHGGKRIPRSGKWRREWVFILQGGGNRNSWVAPDGGERPDPYDHSIISLSWEFLKRGITCFCGGPVDGDAAFIAHAREDIPALLEEIDRLRAALTPEAKP